MPCDRELRSEIPGARLIVKIVQGDCARTSFERPPPLENLSNDLMFCIGHAFHSESEFESPSRYLLGSRRTLPDWRGPAVTSFSAASPPW